MVTAVTYRDANPPYLFPAYDSTVDRAPKEPLIEAPSEWIGRVPLPRTGLTCAVLRKPSAGRLPGGQPMAPYVNVTVFARGLLKQVQTRLYFPDEERSNAADPVLCLVPSGRRPALIARHDGDDLRFDIRLQGTGETPFFGF